jgi:hypothetical protein
MMIAVGWFAADRPFAIGLHFLFLGCFSRELISVRGITRPHLIKGF